MLVTGQLGASGISSITYYRYSHLLYVMPEISISSHGAVKSVLLLSKTPVEDLDGKRVLLTSASATSQVLVQIILSRRYQVRPRYEVAVGPPVKGLIEADACLLIGDEALSAYYAPPPNLWLYDLGAEWRQLTGMPMVYGLWACRRDFAARYPEEMKTLAAYLQQAAQLAQETRGETAAIASNLYPYEPSWIEDYFQGLDYSLGEKNQAGLLSFFSLAAEEGLLSGQPTPLEFLETGRDVCLQQWSLPRNVYCQSLASR
jgi:chorismate dehydratase